MKKLLLILLCLPMIGFGQSDCGQEPKEPKRIFSISHSNWKKHKDYKRYKSKSKIWKECMSLNGETPLPEDCNFIESIESVFDSSKVFDMKSQKLYLKLGRPYINSTHIWMRFFHKDGNQYLMMTTSTPRAGNIKLGNKLFFLLKNNEKIELKCDVETKQEVSAGTGWSSYNSIAYYFITKEQLKLFSESPIIAFKLTNERTSYESQNVKTKRSTKIQDDAICMNIATQDIDFVNKRRKRINEANGEWAGNGSGIIISKSGYIVTNHHVIDYADDIEVEFILDDEVKTFNAEIIQSDKVNDLAIIKIVDVNFDGVKELPYNFKTRSSDVGTKVYAYGYPMALSIMGKEIKVTDGIISSKTGFDGDITTYQISAPIQGGNSGGPLFDDKGNLIGINSSGINKKLADNVGYSIKTSYVLNLIDILPKSIDLPSNKKLASSPLIKQIKEISKYVVLVKVK